jgi:AraC-like DNA-binding protein
MSSAPGLRAPSSGKDVFFLPRPAQLPYALDMHAPDVTTARLEGGGPERATIVCGFLGLDARPFNPLLAALPRVLHLPGRVLGQDSWVTTFLRTAVAESNLKRPGGEAVLERMSEMLFVEVLRRYVDSLPAGQTGWLAGMRDPVVGRALSLLHQKPAEAWTLETLGAEAGMSRSSLHDRFVHFIGQPPMQYLTNWRMQLAAGRLRDTDAKVVDVALDVGYESEAAFSRAFKRVVGVAPGTWRRERRTAATRPSPR